MNLKTPFTKSTHSIDNKHYKCDSVNTVILIKLLKYGSMSLSEQRLLIAKEFGDRSAERRAYCNLGNAYIFLGEFEVAAEHYK